MTRSRWVTTGSWWDWSSVLSWENLVIRFCTIMAGMAPSTHTLVESVHIGMRERVVTLS